MENDSMDDAASHDIVNTRVFDAARDRVFHAIADPALLARWWGPHGFTSTFHEFDLRPGGAWSFVMRGPDGIEYPMTHRFVEVVEPERIVVDHIQESHDFRLAIGLADEAGGTRVTWRMRFASPDEAARLRSFLLSANEENLDRLGEVLASET
jgi:uncharacterized protein YndB with AHSA1/START domain